MVIRITDTDNIKEEVDIVAGASNIQVVIYRYKKGGSFSLHHILSLTSQQAQLLAADLIVKAVEIQNKQVKKFDSIQEMNKNIHIV